MFTVDQAGGPISFGPIDVVVGWQVVTLIPILFLVIVYGDIIAQKEAAAVGAPTEPMKGWRLFWHFWFIFFSKAGLGLWSWLQINAMVSANYFVAFLCNIGGPALGDAIYSVMTNDAQEQVPTLDKDIASGLNGRKALFLAWLAALSETEPEEALVPTENLKVHRHRLPPVKVPAARYKWGNTFAYVLTIPIQGIFWIYIVFALLFRACGCHVWYPTHDSALQTFHTVVAGMAQAGWITVFVLSAIYEAERPFYILVGIVLVLVYGVSSAKVLLEIHLRHQEIKAKAKATPPAPPLHGSSGRSSSSTPGPTVVTLNQRGAPPASPVPPPEQLGLAVY